MYLVTFSYIRSSCTHPKYHLQSVSSFCHISQQPFAPKPCVKATLYDKKPNSKKLFYLLISQYQLCMPRRNDLWSFPSLGSLSLEIKVCTFLPFLLTFHLPNSPPETFVSHPVFLSRTRFAPPSGALRRPFYQASLAYVTDVSELVNYAVMNQHSVFTNSSFDLPPIILLVCWLHVGDGDKKGPQTSCKAKGPEPHSSQIQLYTATKWAAGLLDHLGRGSSKLPFSY